MGCDVVFLLLFGEMTQPIMGILLEIMVGAVFMWFLFGFTIPCFEKSTTPQVEDPPQQEGQILTCKWNINLDINEIKNQEVWVYYR